MYNKVGKVVGRSYDGLYHIVVVARLPSNNVQHWKYVDNGDSGISVLKLTKLSIEF